MFQAVRNVALKSFGIGAFFVQCGCMAHCVFEYIADIVVCSGSSMEPTLYTNNILVTEHVSPRLNRIQRGDIIIALCPTDPKQYICKRVTGVPGDKMKHGLFIDVVPTGYVWLEGDNRKNSTDSRSYGPVPEGLIRSRAVCRIWPLQDARMLTSSEDS